MFISHRYEFIFLEVPRTGTHSVSNLLYEIDPESPTAEQRLAGDPYFAYHDFRIPRELHGYTIIAGHRNPYSRLWSYWKYRNRTGNPEMFKSVSWHEYVRWACNPEDVPRITGAIEDKPVTELLEGTRVDVWLRFDHLREDWRAVCARLGLPHTELEHINPSQKRGGFRSAYDAWLAGKVHKRFRADFETFGYSPDSWRDPAGSERAAPGNAFPSAASTPVLSGHRARVAILTHFPKSDPAFSLNHVVQDQIAMLVDHGYRPRVLVTESRNWKEKPDNYALAGVELVELPRTRGLEPDAMKDVPVVYEALNDALKDIDVVLAHDIIYLPSTRVINAAAFQVARENPSVKWLHWVHSAARVAAMFAMKELETGIEHQICSWPNANVVCFNHMAMERLADHFGCAESDVRVVPHPFDACRFFGLSDLASDIYKSLELHQADFICTLPVRLDHGKQVEWVIRIMSRIKAAGDSIRLIVMDFHSQDETRSDYRSELKSIASMWNVDEDELVFLSEYSKSSRRHSPRSLVRELLTLSSVFIFPSRSETYSLAVQEAAITGNLLVLNEDFPPMRELYGENALYFKFSADMDRTTGMDGVTQSVYADVETAARPAGFLDSQIYQDGDRWYLKGEVAYADYIASCIRHEFQCNKVLAQRRERLRHRNTFSVFKQHLEPLFYS